MVFGWQSLTLIIQAEEAQTSLGLEAAGTLTGIVDGVGALSGAIFQIIIPLIEKQLFLVEAGIISVLLIDSLNPFRPFWNGCSHFDPCIAKRSHQEERRSKPKVCSA